MRYIRFIYLAAFEMYSRIVLEIDIYREELKHTTFSYILLKNQLTHYSIYNRRNFFTFRSYINQGTSLLFPLGVCWFRFMRINHGTTSRSLVLEIELPLFTSLNVMTDLCAKINNLCIRSHKNSLLLRNLLVRRKE